MKTGNASCYYPEHRSQRMIRRRGFTLIEAVVALAIMGVVMTTLFQGQRNLVRRTQVDLPTVEWYLMLHELENPDHHFVVAHISDEGGLTPGKAVHLVNTVTGKQYLLTYYHILHRIALHHYGGGEIQLIRGVRQFHVDDDLTLTMTTDKGIHFQAQLLLPDRRGAMDEEATRNDSDLGD
ncbi:type II secretion system protein [Lactiplantibacillus argentoratensis]|uniref:Type II secretion system protein n=2 Tax=Lactiplantibacillus argentoratensis TaxID=271881 RepID=A0AAN1UIK8_9LACO|nr:type II secretion system protein [Lactiplantibacillus argentoratensis]MCT4444821.1 type II secretion system protein [Lactiplantibacillus argentoratensis]MPQ39178.1 prepilin-type N-terminal cleavage/methylation domain-containing protein [Lactiplantibacillus plantarum]MZU92001.1 prepilin-type cleavage/methylation domain-containing protein [Lactiplantibacillus plantarum]GEO54073.1 prepilin-type N-terminal cleavage/methylation domain-containing protein [Lactiplantibacillus argentoratensis]